MTEDTLFLIIRTRQEIVFQGEIRSISSVNEKGPFDILSRHAYFISLIQKNLVIVQMDHQKQEIKIEVGIIVVEDNKVRVYLETQIPS